MRSHTTIGEASGVNHINQTRSIVSSRGDLVIDRA